MCNHTVVHTSNAITHGNHTINMHSTFEQVLAWHGIVLGTQNTPNDYQDVIN